MKSFEILIKRYIKILETKGEPNEKYKYDSIDVFQKYWDIEAPDFYKMFLNSLAKRSNLLFQNSWGFIHLLAKHLPEKARTLFKNLYDETMPIEERVANFQKECENLVDDVKNLSYKQTLNHQQDERTISLYLAFRYPEKYILYKNDFYKNYCEEFGLKIEKVGNKFFHLNHISDDIVESNLLYDDEFQRIYRKFYPKPKWNDDRLVIQNILYVCYQHEKNQTNIVDILNKFDYEDLLKYYDFLDEIIEKFNLFEEDKRLVFNINEKELIFTIGQRYVWNLRNIKHNNFKFRAISTNQFSSNYEKFDGESFVFLNNETNHSLIISNSQNIYNAVENELYRTKISGYAKYNDVLIEKLAFDKDYRDSIFAQLDKNKKSEFIVIDNSIMKKFPLNQILYGPPGTGKTYQIIEKAVQIANPNFDINLSRNLLKAEYERLQKNGQIVFTTFHQSMSYEDFIEGIKPEIEEDAEGGKSVIYEVKDGIFKEICVNSSKNSDDNTKSENHFEIAWENLIERIKEKISNDELLKIGSWEYGLSSKNSLKYSSLNSPSQYTFTITQKNILDTYQNKKARPSGAFQKDMEDIVAYMKSEFQLLDYSEKQYENKKVSSINYVLIIDEINRGNVSQIFGELITLIEDDKRLGNDEALEVILPYSKEKFGVPANLHIIGTMNTADRSVEALDTALRRRFSFVEMMPEYEKLYEIQFENFNLGEVLETINHRIEALLDRDHTIGHSYFINIQPNDTDALKEAFQNKIIPLLQEYFYHDYEKIALILGQGFVECSEPKESMVEFAKWQGKSLEKPDAARVFKIKSLQNFEMVSAVNSLINRE